MADEVTACCCVADCSLCWLDNCSYLFFVITMANCIGVWIQFKTAAAAGLIFGNSSTRARPARRYRTVVTALPVRQRIQYEIVVWRCRFEANFALRTIQPATLVARWREAFLLTALSTLPYIPRLWNSLYRQLCAKTDVGFSTVLSTKQTYVLRKTYNRILRHIRCVWYIDLLLLNLGLFKSSSQYTMTLVFKHSSIILLA